MVVDLLLELPRREPTPEVERILMVDFATTQARAKGVARSASREEGQTGTATTKTPSSLTSPTTDRVDRMYRQLAEIHAITAVQLAECAHWRWLDLMSSSVRAETYQ
jgi:hypothetical protein